MAKSPRFKSLWPCPVYVATFADGTTRRMSFASPANKPLDFERGRRLLAWACAQIPVDQTAEIAGYKPVRNVDVDGYGRALPITRRRVEWAGYDRSENSRKPIGMRGTLVERGIAEPIAMRADGTRFARSLPPMMPPRSDMIAGYVDHDGQRHEDPFFAPSNVVPLPKKRVSKAAADLDKAVAIIAALEAQFGACFPAECSEAMDFLLNREAA